MLSFSILEGTRIMVLKAGKELTETNVEHTTIKKEAMYFREDVVLDCRGKLTESQYKTPYGMRLQREGWYGFKLPDNKRGYELLLVPSRYAYTDPEDYHMAKYGREV